MRSQRQRTAGWLAVLALLSAGAGQAQATEITFTRSAPFFAAIGASPSFTEGYEGLAINTILPTGTVLNGITYTFPATVSGRIDNLFNFIGTRDLAASRPGLELNGFFFPGDSIGLSFAAPVFGVGIFINAGPTAAVGDYFISTPVGTVGTGGPATNYDMSTFFFAGILSDTPFTTATIGSLPVGPTTGHNVDNLTIVLAVPQGLVPEPAGALLAGAGALGLAGYAWRRRRQPR